MAHAVSQTSDLTDLGAARLPSALALSTPRSERGSELLYYDPTGNNFDPASANPEIASERRDIFAMVNNRERPLNETFDRIADFWSRRGTALDAATVARTVIWADTQIGMTFGNCTRYGQVLLPMLDALVERFDELRAGTASHLAASVSRLNLWHPQLYEGIRDTFLRTQLLLKPEHLTEYAEFFAKINESDPHIRAAVVNNALDCIGPGISAANACTLVYSTAVLGGSRQLESALVEFDRNIPIGTLDLSRAGALSLAVSAHDLDQFVQELPLGRIIDAYQRIQSCRPAEPSPFQVAVRTALQDLPLQVEKIIPQFSIRGIHANFALINGDITVALECMGNRFHRVGGIQEQRPLGGESLRAKIFAHANIPLVSITDTEWHSGTDVDRCELLTSRLKLCGL